MLRMERYSCAGEGRSIARSPKQCRKFLRDKLEETAHRLAYHFNEAGEHENALKYYLMAAEAADGINAESESASHYTSALESARLAKSPESELDRIISRLNELATSVH